MYRSVIAAHANRPVTRFVRSAGRVTTRRLGLRSFGSFTPASASATILRRADVGPVVGRRSDWPSPVSRRASAGAPRPSIAIHWAQSARVRADRRSSAAAAPWRG